MIMHRQTLISLLVQVNVLCLTSVVSEFKSELAGKLNMLVRHPGWRDDMHDVRILINKRKDISDPMTAILEAISSNRNPIDEINVMERYKEIWTMLMCKYAEIIYKYKVHIQNYIRVCKNEKIIPPGSSFQSYYDCFRLLLVKLHSVSARFKCLQDALEFLYTLTPQRKPRHSVMIATAKLTKYTLTLGPETSAKLSLNGFNVDVVDHEIKNISAYIFDVYIKHVYKYTRKHCTIPKDTKLAPQNLDAEFYVNKRDQLIPNETTLMDYVVNEMDCFVSEIFDKWFYNLGFVYGVQGMVKIGIN